MDFLVTKETPPEKFRPIEVKLSLNTVEEAREFQARMHMSLRQVRTGLNGYFNHVTSLCGESSMMCGITTFRKKLAKKMGYDSLTED